jgi:3-deoxy-D-manno-octulosonate 8-phosphate phosphatase (KDO 8-P phosphatase)
VADVSLEVKAARIKLLLFDVDGVLTDGRVLIHADATESKYFGIRDGIAMVWAQRAGLRIGLLSARTSATTVHRASQLGVTLIQQGVSNKTDSYRHMRDSEGLSDADVAYMGDDIVDLAVLRRVGLSAAPADAVDEVRSSVDWVSSRPGGAGAVRELIEMVLKQQDRWAAVVGDYLDESSTPGRHAGGAVVGGKSTQDGTVDPND